MEFKHTKGEWLLVYNNNSLNEWRIESVRVLEWSNNDLMADYQGSIIADFTQSHGERSHAYTEAEANAKLISAAPDLLDACIKALDIFKQLADAGRYPEMLMAENGGEGLAFLSDAIKKATE